MRNLILGLFTVTSLAFCELNLEANEFGFAPRNGCGSNCSSSNRNVGNAYYGGRQPVAVRGRSADFSEAGSNGFQDLLQTIQRTSQVQHRESTRRMIYRREVEHLEIESRDVDHRSVTHEDLLNKLRSGASDYYRNGRRNQSSQW
mgnify:CR=1 FL=1